MTLVTVTGDTRFHAKQKSLLEHSWQNYAFFRKIVSNFRFARGKYGFRNENIFNILQELHNIIIILFFNH